MTGGKTPHGVVDRRAREPPVERESAALASGAFEKHWTIIVEAERLARRLDLPLAVFCKSGKDRTGQRTNQILRCF